MWSFWRLNVSATVVNLSEEYYSSLQGDVFFTADSNKKNALNKSITMVWCMFPVQTDQVHRNNDLFASKTFKGIKTSLMLGIIFGVADAWGFFANFNGLLSQLRIINAKIQIHASSGLSVKVQLIVLACDALIHMVHCAKTVKVNNNVNRIVDKEWTLRAHVKFSCHTVTTQFSFPSHEYSLSTFGAWTLILFNIVIDFVWQYPCRRGSWEYVFPQHVKFGKHN